MSQSVYRKIGVATLIMVGSLFLSRVMGVLRESTLAALGGAGTAVDAYKIAFVIPEVINHMMASGFFSVTFIPIFTRYVAAENQKEAWRVFSAILSVFGSLLVLLVLVAMALAPQLMHILAPGRSDPHFFLLAVRMTRILLPAQLFFFAGGIFMAVQFANERFLLPALSGLIYNSTIIAGGILLNKLLGVEGFAWGALCGAFLGSFLVQLIGAGKVGMRFRLNFDWRHPELRRYILLTLPLMFGLTMTFSTEIFSKIFGSFLPAGAITHIDFGWRLILMLVAFFGQAVGVASFPFLAKLAAEQRIDEMNELFNNTLRYLALVIPVSFLMFVLRYDIVRVLFEHGDFTATDTKATALALSGMLVGAVAFAAQGVVNRGFYAMQNTILPAVYGSAAVLISLPMYWVGVTNWGELGIGLAVSLSALVQVLVLFGVWNRRSDNKGRGRVYRFYLKVLVLSMPVTVVLMVTQRLLAALAGPAGFTASAVIIILQSTLFLLLMAGATWVFKIDEARIVWHKILRKLRK